MRDGELANDSDSAFPVYLLKAIAFALINASAF